jgi:hypothetical protein
MWLPAVTKTAQLKREFNPCSRNIHLGCFVYTSAAAYNTALGFGTTSKTPRWQPRGGDTHLSGR